jgi:hypothetical protein
MHYIFKIVLTNYLSSKVYNENTLTQSFEVHCATYFISNVKWIFQRFKTIRASFPLCIMNLNQVLIICIVNV